MVIDDTIRKIIKRAIEQMPGGGADIGRKIGADKSTVSRLADGTTSEVTAERWERLWPVLVPFGNELLRPCYLPDSELRKMAPGLSNPCRGKPAELAALCAAWDSIPSGEQEVLLAAIRVTLRKPGPRENARPVRKGRSG